MARFDLTDAEWAVIEPLLPTDVRGKERVDDRRVLNGIFWRLRTGAPWADIPASYGPHTTCGNRFRRWRKRGIDQPPRGGPSSKLVQGRLELTRFVVHDLCNFSGC
ncbi:transposase, partial [Methylobacterium radiotolerans]